MNSKVNIALLLPIFNAEKHLAETLKSIQNQSMKNFNLLIIDDNSKDDSASIALEFCLNNTNFSFIQNNKNIGMINNFIFGVTKLKEMCPDAQFFSLIGQDDLYEEKWLERNSISLNTNPKAIASQSHVKYFWNDGRSAEIRNDDLNCWLNLYKIYRYEDDKGNNNRYTIFIHGLIKMSFVDKYFIETEKYVESLFLLEQFIVCLFVIEGGICGPEELLMYKRKLDKGNGSDWNLKYPDSSFSAKLNSKRNRIFATIMILKNHKSISFRVYFSLCLYAWYRGLKPSISRLVNK